MAGMMSGTPRNSIGTGLCAFTDAVAVSGALELSVIATAEKSWFGPAEVMTPLLASISDLAAVTSSTRL